MHIFSILSSVVGAIKNIVVTSFIAAVLFCGCGKNTEFKSTQQSSSVGGWNYPESKPSPTWTGSGAEEDPYLITTAQQLADLAYLVNNGESFEEKSFALGADIDLNSGIEINGKTKNAKEWIPIGTFETAAKSLEDDSAAIFQGNFDGRFHKIDGLYINGELRYAGLFGNIGYDSIVKNLVMGKGYVRSKRQVSYAGSIVGCLRGKIICCGNEATDVFGNCFVGGIAGHFIDYHSDVSWANPSIAFSYNKANVSNADDTKNVQIGGIVGSSYKCKIVGCYNLGTVSAKAKKVFGRSSFFKVYKEKIVLAGIAVTEGGEEDYTSLYDCYIFEDCGTADFLVGVYYDLIPEINRQISCQVFNSSQKSYLLNKLNEASENIWVAGDDGWPTFRK